jgi:hypothetical protein
VHRVGPLQPGDQIVLVAVSSAHRGQAFQACEFLMDYLKTQAPFWKKETTPEGARWVDARVADDAALARWGIAAGNGATARGWLAPAGRADAGGRNAGSCGGGVVGCQRKARENGACARSMNFHILEP